MGPPAPFIYHCCCLLANILWDLEILLSPTDTAEGQTGTDSTGHRPPPRLTGNIFSPNLSDWEEIFSKSLEATGSEAVTTRNKNLQSCCPVFSYWSNLVKKNLNIKVFYKLILWQIHNILGYFVKLNELNENLDVSC